MDQGYRRLHMIAPTASDVRDVIIEGDSGLMKVCWPHDQTDNGEHMGRPIYEPSKRRVTWANRAMATLGKGEAMPGSPPRRPDLVGAFCWISFASPRIVRIRAEIFRRSWICRAE
jgi:phage terminase large subunit-like protein